ncbi:alpha/beta fold hydrolase [Paenibacillus filicis]|uniref:Alpha/beta fold hydrolase n=1 Tax=Paenibacillus gyeongsangnamensis TaxID=3388067 RepID=A0ABT4QJV4_9BACL|nr:alpha/beta fold hydrolase [Paenibacillus filicis]MCZ8517151.1 alpha/beta fold hydrolase [Paenibacillus filicis]
MPESYANAIEKRIQELYHYMPPRTAKSDLSAFWERNLRSIESKPLNAKREAAVTPLAAVTAYRVTYEGFDATPIHGWFLLPKHGGAEPRPCIVKFHGYTGGSEYPEQHAQWLLMGYAVFAVDIRGQGGETGNLLPQTFGMTKGWITQGILDREACYYNAITADALKALAWAREQPEVDSSRIAVVGSSQGGGLALMTAALSDIPSAAIAHIPNMCHMDYGLLHSTGSLTEAAAFVAKFPDRLERVLETLSYFDLINLADRISIPVHVSVGLKDTVCLPETVFAACNRIAAPKIIEVHPFSGHEVGTYQNRQGLLFLQEWLLG